MQDSDLAQNCIWVFEKFFYSYCTIPKEIESKWLEFRELLLEKPINNNKIRKYVNTLYDLSMISINSPELTSKKSLKVFLRKKSVFDKESIMNENKIFENLIEKDKKGNESKKIHIVTNQIENYLNENNVNSAFLKQKIAKRFIKNNNDQLDSFVSPVTNKYELSVFQNKQNLNKNKSKFNFEEKLLFDTRDLKELCNEFQGFFKKNTEMIYNLNQNIVETESPLINYVPLNKIGEQPVLKLYSLYINEDTNNQG